MTAKNIPQHSEQEIRVPITLMNFVHDDVRRAGYEGRAVSIERSQEHSVGAKGEQSAGRDSEFEERKWGVLFLDRMKARLYWLRDKCAVKHSFHVRKHFTSFSWLQMKVITQCFCILSEMYRCKVSPTILWIFLQICFVQIYNSQDQYFARGYFSLLHIPDTTSKVVLQVPEETLFRKLREKYISDCYAANTQWHPYIARCSDYSTNLR